MDRLTSEMGSSKALNIWPSPMSLGRHGRNALIAGILVPLLLLLLGVICCAYCCSANRLAPKDR